MAMTNDKALEFVEEHDLHLQREIYARVEDKPLWRYRVIMEMDCYDQPDLEGVGLTLSSAVQDLMEEALSAISSSAARFASWSDRASSILKPGVMDRIALGRLSLDETFVAQEIEGEHATIIDKALQSIHHKELAGGWCAVFEGNIYSGASVYVLNKDTTFGVMTWDSLVLTAETVGERSGDVTGEMVEATNLLIAEVEQAANELLVQGAMEK